MIYYIVDATGELVSRLTLSNVDALAANLQPGQYVCPVPPPLTPAWWDESADTWVVKPEKPSTNSRWDPVQKVWYDPRTPTEITAQLTAQATSRRNALLAASDWSQMPDSPLITEQKTAWAEYRTLLRNVPQQAGFPTTIDWPVQPA